MLLAQALNGRPKLLILDGVIHEIPSPQLEAILSRICAVERPGTAVIVTTDPNIKSFVQQSVSLN